MLFDWCDMRTSHNAYVGSVPLALVSCTRTSGSTARHASSTPRTTDTSACDAIEKPTTKDVKRFAVNEAGKICNAKFELHSFWPGIGLTALFFAFACPAEGLPVMAIIGLVCAYPFLNQKRQCLLLEKQRICGIPGDCHPLARDDESKSSTMNRESKQLP